MNLKFNVIAKGVYVYYCISSWNLFIQPRGLLLTEEGDGDKRYWYTEKTVIKSKNIEQKIDDKCWWSKSK